MANGLDRLALALQGFGAGVAGNLPQFQQGLANAEEQERQRLALEQQQQNAMRQQQLTVGANAAFTIDKLKNDPRALVQVLPQLQADFDQLGIQTPFAAAIDMAASGNTGALNELIADAEQGVKIARARGLLPEVGDDTDPVQSSEFLPGGNVRLVRRSGRVEVVEETPEAIEAIRQAEERANRLAAQRAGGKAAATGEEKLKTERSLNAITADRAKGVTLAKSEADRLSDYISNGLQAVEQLPTINRGLELLDQVKTGGLTAASKAITDVFGVTGGDIGELNNILGQRVVDGLQQFSGAISEGEREFIRRIETDISRGTASNIAILKRGRDILKRKIKRARDAAEASRDDFALSVFANPEGFSFNQSKPASADGITPDTQQPAPAPVQRFRFNPETGKLEPK